MTTPQQQPQFPPLTEITHLTPSCIRILAGNPGPFTLQGTNTYLLGTGPSRILIDTGEGKPSWIAALRQVLNSHSQGEGNGKAGGGKVEIAFVLLTHWHRDHTGGVRDLVREWPGVRVYKHRGGEFLPSQLRDKEEEVKVEDIADGQRFTVDGATLTAVHTPGHTADHTVFLWEEEGALFTGDNVLGHGTSVFEDLGLYVDSLERMGGLYDNFNSNNEAGGDNNKGKAYPGHGAVVDDGPGKVAEYIRHRAQREEQVVQALRSFAASGSGTGSPGEVPEPAAKGDAWTVMELVKSIYRDVPEHLHPAAANGVAQILQKLKKEGRVVVVEDGERWRLAASSPGRSAL